MLVSPSRLRPRALRLAISLTALCGCGALAIGAGAAGAAGTVSSKRSLVLSRRDPAVVRGSGFRAHRRVRVTLVAGHVYVRRPLPNGHGTFTVAFPTAVDRCTSWSVTAIQGAAAPVVIRGAKPECAPASTP